MKLQTCFLLYLIFQLERGTTPLIGLIFFRINSLTEILHTYNLKIILLIWNTIHKWLWEPIFTVTHIKSFKHSCICLIRHVLSIITCWYYIYWQLIFLTLDEDECQRFPCQNGGTCNNLPGTYECRCTEGWEGKNCEMGMSVFISLIWSCQSCTYLV